MIFPLPRIVICVRFVIDMMIVIKYLVYLSVVFADDYGYAIVEHKSFRDETENVEPVKMESGHES